MADTSSTFSVNTYYYTNDTSDDDVLPIQRKDLSYKGKDVTDAQVKLWAETYKAVIRLINTIGYNCSHDDIPQTCLGVHLTSLMVFCGVKIGEVFTKERRMYYTNAFAYKDICDEFKNAQKLNTIIGDEKRLKKFLQSLTGRQEVRKVYGVDDETARMTTINIFGVIDWF